MLRYSYRFFTLTIAVLPCFKRKNPNFSRALPPKPHWEAYSAPKTSRCHFLCLWHVFLFCKKTMRPYIFLYYPLVASLIYFGLTRTSEFPYSSNVIQKSKETIADRYIFTGKSLLNDCKKYLYPIRLPETMILCVLFHRVGVWNVISLPNFASDLAVVRR